MLSSNHVGNAPLFIWIVAAFWAAARSPVGVTGLIALTNTACLWPLWRWARRRMDEGRALLTLALSAVSPFAVMFSRKIWTQDLLLPGIIAVLWGIEWLRGPRPWRGIVLLAVAALLVGQLHQSGAISVALLPLALAIQFMVDRRRREPTTLGRPSRTELAALVIVVAINVFFWWPYLEYLRQLPADVLANRPREILRPVLLGRIEGQVMPVDLFFFFSPDWQDFLSDPVRSAVYYGSVALGAPLFVYGLWRWARAPFSLPVIGVWWWLMIAVFTIARIPAYPFYVLALAPLTSVLASGGFDPAFRRRAVARLLTTWRVAYATALFGLTIATGAWIAGRGGAAGDYGVTFGVRETQARAIIGRPSSQETTPSSLSCHSLPPEVDWIARSLDPIAAAKPHSFALCDDWVKENGKVVYRWMLRE